MPKKKRVALYHEAMREVVRAMDTLEQHLKDPAVGPNPWHMWMDVKIMMDSDTKVGRITLNDSDNYMFIPDPDFFNEEV